MKRLVPLLLLLSGCDLLESLQGDPEKDCESSAWYADEDGDGLGEGSAVYIGCEDPPDNYVSNHSDASDPDPTDTDTPSASDTEDGSDTEGETDTEATSDTESASGTDTESASETDTESASETDTEST